uniref:Arylacetamide deacetylase-like 4 n=1 Tax=Pseudonaja textilis TaxID=8673 RepID=A0A670Z359_PSETE
VVRGRSALPAKLEAQRCGGSSSLRDRRPDGLHAGAAGAAGRGGARRPDPAGAGQHLLRGHQLRAAGRAGAAGQATRYSCLPHWGRGPGSQEHLCCYLARESDSVVVSVAYRLAPEHRHPAQLDDCLAASTHFLKVAEDYGVDSSRVILAGNEAGGNLAAGVCQILASRPGPAKVHAQILLCPVLQAVDFNLPSYQQNRAVPLLFRERAAFYLLQRLTGDASCLGDILEGSHVPMKLRAQYRKWLSVNHLQEEFKARGYKPTSWLSFKEDVCEALGSLALPECSPLLAEEAVLSLLPETFILTCEYDVLRDDGLLYKKRLEDQRVPVTWCHLANGFHGVIEFFESGWLGFPSGKKGVDDIVSFIKGL